MQLKNQTNQLNDASTVTLTIVGGIIFFCIGLVSLFIPWVKYPVNYSVINNTTTVGIIFLLLIYIAIGVLFIIGVTMPSINRETVTLITVVLSSVIILYDCCYLIISSVNKIPLGPGPFISVYAGIVTLVYTIELRKNNSLKL